MGSIATQITSLTTVYSAVYSGADQRKRHWPLCGEFTGDQWIPRTNSQLRGKCFHLMTSSWWSIYPHSLTDTYINDVVLIFKYSEDTFPEIYIFLKIKMITVYCYTNCVMFPVYSIIMWFENSRQSEDGIFKYISWIFNWNFIEKMFYCFISRQSVRKFARVFSVEIYFDDYTYVHMCTCINIHAYIDIWVLFYFHFPNSS